MLLATLIVAHVVSGPEDLGGLHACCGSASPGALGRAQVLTKPIDSGAQSIEERRHRLKADLLTCTGGVQHPARLPVRLAGVPADLTGEARHLCDQADQLA